MIADEMVEMFERGVREPYRLSAERQRELRARLEASTQLKDEVAALIGLACALDSQLGCPTLSEVIIELVSALVPRLKKLQGDPDARGRRSARLLGAAIAGPVKKPLFVRQGDRTLGISAKVAVRC